MKRSPGFELWSASQKFGQIDIIKGILNDCQSDPSVVEFRGYKAGAGTPLLEASERGHTLSHGADIEAMYMFRLTPLLTASSIGHTEVVKVMLRHGANIEAKAVNGSTPLGFASASGRIEALEVLLSHGADPNVHVALVWQSPGRRSDESHELGVANLRYSMIPKFGRKTRARQDHEV